MDAAGLNGWKDKAGCHWLDIRAIRVADKRQFSQNRMRCATAPFLPNLSHKVSCFFLYRLYSQKSFFIVARAEQRRQHSWILLEGHCYETKNVATRSIIRFSNRNFDGKTPMNPGGTTKSRLILRDQKNLANRRALPWPFKALSL